MGDIHFWKDSIIGDIEEIRAIADSIPSKPDALSRTAAIDQAEKTIRRTKGTCRTMKAEIRIIPDPEESSRYKKELASYEQTLSQLSTDIQALKSEQSRNQLFLNANREGDVNLDDTDPNRAGDALLDGADNIQDKTQQALTNTAVMIAESKLTGAMTLEELERQQQQINSAGQNVDRLEDNLNRADKLIKTFGKRMATDKLIQCFALVNVLLIVGVVIYSIVRGGLNGNTEEVAPESPVDSGSSQTRMLRGVLH